MNSALVMQDKETDTYWSIMTGEAIGGKLKGTKLKELPVFEKVQWKDWVKRHPDTLVLSVNGVEDRNWNPYMDYFRSREGFRGVRAKDKRLATKEPIFSFIYGDEKYAIPYRAFEGGNVFDIGDFKIFLYRPRNAEIFYSTLAFKSKAGFEKRDGEWYEINSNCKFNPETGYFESTDADGQNCPTRFESGFDTFWYNWSLTHPDTKVIK